MRSKGRNEIWQVDLQPITSVSVPSNTEWSRRAIDSSRARLIRSR
jgi:hypothetical protein